MSDKHPCCKSHCCKEHGCKYGHDDCPVVSGTEEQLYPCETCSFVRERTGAETRQIVIDRAEVLRILRENERLYEQVTSLQMTLTMKEEHLRAHRRVKLNPEDQTKLDNDLAETTDRINKGYEELKSTMKYL